MERDQKGRMNDGKGPEATSRSLSLIFFVGGLFLSSTSVCSRQCSRMDRSTDSSVDGIIHCASCSYRVSSSVYQYLPNCDAYMHNACFVDFAVWYEMQDGLREILLAWGNLADRTRRRERCARALELVRQWQQRAFEEGVLRSFKRTTFLKWKSELPPPLVTSSSSDSDSFGSPSSESTSDILLA